MLGLVLIGAVLGIGATILLDLWAIALWRFAGQSRPNWALVGRWFWHLREGKVFHDDIGKAAPWAHELALGWVGHYVVGAVYGVVFALIAGAGWLAAPRLLPAWVFGIATLAFGWFLLQPGLGLGWAASRTPNPAKVRALNLVSHTVFGVGLYLTALLIR
jgi:hypothetical protein